MTVDGSTELDQALSTEERARALSELLAADQHFQRWALFVKVPVEQWPDDVKVVFSKTPLDEETPADVLQRWWNLFSSEVALVHETRNQLVHQVHVSDSVLRRAHVLATRLLNTTAGARSDDGLGAIT